MSTCPVPCLESSLTPSHIQLSCMKICFQNKGICFICGQPSDIYISGHTPINNSIDNPPLYCSGHTPINNYWSTLRNNVMHLHLLFYGAPVHMKCNMLFSCQFRLIYQACIYLHNLHKPTCYSPLAITQTAHMNQSMVQQFILELPKTIQSRLSENNP